MGGGAGAWAHAGRGPRDLGARERPPAPSQACPHRPCPPACPSPAGWRGSPRSPSRPQSPRTRPRARRLSWLTLRDVQSAGLRPPRPLSQGHWGRLFASSCKYRAGRKVTFLRGHTGQSPGTQSHPPLTCPPEAEQVRPNLCTPSPGGLHPMVPSVKTVTEALPPPGQTPFTRSHCKPHQRQGPDPHPAVPRPCPGALAAPGSQPLATGHSHHHHHCSGGIMCGEMRPAWVGSWGSGGDAPASPCPRSACAALRGLIF